MAEVTVTLTSEMGNMSAMLQAVEASTRATAAAMDRLDQTMTQVEEIARKATQSNVKQAKATEDIAKASILASKSVSGLSSIYALNERSTETLTRISQQYSDILKETGQRGSELEKAWRQGLSPAEKTALKIAELGSKYAYAGTESKALGAAVTELGKRLEDQQRRADTNVGSQNKLSRSLSELMDEANNTRIMVGALNTAGLAELNKTATATKQRLDAVETAMSALSIPGADLVARGRGIADAFETMTEHGGKWGTVALAGGVAIGTITAAAGAATLTVAGLTAAIVANSAAADEWNDELKKLQIGLTGIAEKQLDRAAASIDAMGSAAKRAGVAIASSMAPEVENLATTVVAAELAITDLWNQFSEGGPILGRVRAWITETAATLEKWSTAASFIPGLNTIGTSMALGFKAVQMSAGAVAEGVVKLEEVTKNYRDEAEKLVTAQHKLNDVENESEKQIKRTADARKEAEQALKDELDARESSFESYLTGMERIAESESKLAADKKKADEDEMERVLNIWQAQHDAAMDVAEVERDIANERAAQQDAFVASMADSAKAILSEYAKTSETAFRIQQAVDLAQVGMDTASAIVKAIALFGPPPSPAGIAGIATAGAIGGFQAAAIASQQPPSVSVSDAYIPAGGPRNVSLAPGDTATVTRAGDLGQTSRLNGGDDDVLMLEQTSVMRMMASEISALRREMLYSRVSGGGMSSTKPRSYKR